MEKSNKVNEVILGSLCLLALVGGLAFQNQTASVVIIGLLVLAAIFILGRNLPEFAKISADNPKVKTMRFLTWFTVGIVVIHVGLAKLFQNQLLSSLQEKWTSIILVVVLMVVIGNLAPKLPFNRYMGLRLPWTVRDEETWILAHRILGYITFPLVIGFIVLCQYFELKTIIPITFLAWILIPGIISGVYFVRKFR